MVFLIHTEAFIRERRILHNVSPATIEWYKSSLKAFEPVLQADLEPVQLKQAITARIEELRTERHNSAVTVNTYLRCLKAFFNWCHGEQILKAPIKLKSLREEKKVLVTFSAEQVKRFVNFKPAPYKGNWKNQSRRLHALICLLLDTGLRIDEALSLTPKQIDFDNMVIRVKGKGNKERLVPMSLELRKILFRFLKNVDPPALVFTTRSGGKLNQRHVLGEFKLWATHLGITGVRVSPHTCRHTFAVNYIRRGGNLEYLRRILGHTSIETTQKYLESLGIQDLQRVHDRLTLLNGH